MFMCHFRSVHTQKSSLHPKMFQNHRSDDHFDKVEVIDNTPYPEMCCTVLQLFGQHQRVVL